MKKEERDIYFIAEVVAVIVIDMIELDID